MYQIQLQGDLLLIEKTWNHTENQGKAKFLKVIKKLIIWKFFKDCTNHRKKAKRVVAFSHNLYPTLLNKMTTDEAFQQSEKQDWFRHLLKHSASMCQSSCSFLQNCRLRKIKSGYDHNFGVTWILHSFRLAL